MRVVSPQWPNALLEVQLCGLSTFQFSQLHLMESFTGSVEIPFCLALGPVLGVKERPEGAVPTDVTFYYSFL